MNMATISATSDVDKTVLVNLQASLPEDLSVEVDERQIILRAAEPPSWISLIAEADIWVKALAAYATLYVAEIVKEAAKDTWKNKGKALKAVVGVTNKMWRLASSLLEAKSKSRTDTYISVGLPVPDDVYTTFLKCQSSNVDDLVVELALFVHHIPELIKYLDENGLAEGAAVGWLSLKILDDGSMELTWMDKETLNENRHVFPLQS